MENPDFKRKLAAIFHADVKGYSRLMGEDEEATLRTLTVHLETMTALIAEYQGRVVGTEGDAILAEFASVNDAVRCAVQVQKTLNEKNGPLPKNRQMNFRIGINLGDVIVEGDQIYGDGVNIAARIESLADGGGISISETVYDQIVGKLNLTYAYQGKQTVKNIKKPVKVYRVIDDGNVDRKKDQSKRKKKPRRIWLSLVLVGILGMIVGAVLVRHRFTAPVHHPVKPALLEEMAFPLPEKPSIAVLPFDNMSGDPDQAFLADGISENIITALSLIPEIFVIARNSTFVYKGKPVNIQQVSKELGVKYVLEGSVQKSDARIRVTAQLIDATTGHHLWAERYDQDMANLFDLQDEITLKILRELQIELTEGDQRDKHATTDNLEAWGLVVKGIGFFDRFTHDDNIHARDLFEQAIQLDAEYALAWTMLAWTHVIDIWMGYVSTPGASIDKASRATETSARLKQDQADIHSLWSAIHLIQRQYDQAIAEGEKALKLGPNNSLSHALMGMVMLLTGNFERAITLSERSIRLAPYCEDWQIAFLAQSYRQAGRYKKALATFQQTLERSREDRGNPLLGLVGLTDVSMQLGNIKQARYYADEILKEEPEFTIESFRHIYFFKNPEHLERILVNLRKAGLPEIIKHDPAPKPSIAVLPFLNLSEDRSQEYFSDGMTEDLITDLSKISGLLVIARNSVFSYKGKSLKIEQISKELGVRYVLEGSVRKLGSRVRINAQLIDAHTGGHIWAERYDRGLEDIFAVQDEVTQKIVAAMVVNLTTDEKKRLNRKQTKNIEAYDYTLRGADLISRITEKNNAEAQRMFQKAIDLDPQYAAAHAWMGWTYWMAWVFEWHSDPMQLDRALELAERALNLDPSLSTAHNLRAKYYLWQKQHDRAIEILKKNIALNPNDADSIAGLGESLHFAGFPKRAIAMYEKAIRLNPIPPVWYYHGLGTSYYLSGQYSKSLAALKRVINRNPNFWPSHIYAAASYAGLGDIEKAKAEIAEVVRIVPDISLENSKRKLPYKDPAVYERLKRSLNQAGLK